MRASRGGGPNGSGTTPVPGAVPAPPVPGLWRFQRLNAATGWTLQSCRFDGSRHALGLVPDPPGQGQAAIVTTGEVPADPFDTLLVSWNASAPGASSLEVEVRVRQDGRLSRWYPLAAWMEGDGRRSSGAVRDADGSVLTDTLALTRAAQAWQCRLTLQAAPGGPDPRLTLLAVQTRARAQVGSPELDAGCEDAPRFLGRELVVPPITQYAFTGGGEAWCSPASLTMLLRYWHETLGLPGPTPRVPQVAAAVYDPVYGGCGNWTFNTAHAGRGPLRAYLALLPSLRAAEAFLASGRPLAASVAWQDGQLPGAPLPASRGHLLVVRGFAPNGDVIVNDPAAPSDLEVRRAYPRGAFERLWLGHSLGLVYVLEPVED